MAKAQNLLFSQVLGKKVRQSGLRQKELAERAGVTDRTLSMLINGSRRASPELAERLAKELGSGDKLVNEFLVAAGYSPKSAGSGRLAMLQLLSIADMAQHELAIGGEEVWIFCRGIAELIEPALFKALVANLEKKTRYFFFLNESNALDWVQLSQRLSTETGNKPLPLECIILSDNSYHTRSMLYRRIYTLYFPEGGSPSCFQAFKAPEGLFYLEADTEESRDIFDYLSAVRLDAVKNAQKEGGFPLLPAHHTSYIPQLLKRYISGT